MLKVLITGDFCPTNRVEDLINRSQYSSIFNDFLPIIQEADIAITNLECPITQDGNMIKKTGPNLKAPMKSMLALSYSGFDLITAANNHIMDFGVDGLNSTVNSIKKSGLSYVGVGSNLEEARKPYFNEINGIRFAIINFCENEWSTATGAMPGANALNLITNHYDIKTAKEKADYVFVIVHGGHENYPLPSPRMQETYRFFIESGADAVIGHHTHCYSGYETYKGKLIFYSLGNFIFDWPAKRNSTWNSGYAVQFYLGNSTFNFSIHPYIQGDSRPGVRLMNEMEILVFNKQLELYNQQIASPEILDLKFMELANCRKRSYLSYFEPYSNRYLSALNFRGLFPSIISAQKKKALLNLIRCEAHRDLVLKSLKD
jgi:poly-gamma-glutamate capsule biosynthesis protein CapA/YwtB (metallophosphatase superfamily)